MRNRCLFFILLLTACLCSVSASAQEGDAQIDSLSNDAGYLAEMPADTSLTFIDYSTDDSINAFKHSKDFAYITNLDSLLRLLKSLKNDTLSYHGERGKTKRQSNNNEPDIVQTDTSPSMLASPGIKIFLWILAGGFILFILYKLFFAEGIFKKEVRLKKTEQEEEEQPELLSDFDRNIQQALNSGNYRLAVRYLYLQSLKKLSDAGQIQYATDKTNYQYVREVYSKPYRNEFAALTLNYEYIWYGNFDIDEKICMRLRDEFNQFNSKI